MPGVYGRFVRYFSNTKMLNREPTIRKLVFSRPRKRQILIIIHRFTTNDKASGTLENYVTHTFNSTTY